MTHIVLAAAEEGLGTCWVGAFDPAAAREVLGLPPEVILNAPFFQLGTLDKICENIQAARDRWGINYFAFQQDAIDAAAPIVSRLAGK